MTRIPDRSVAVVSLAAAIGFVSACSLTGPLDGYAEGDPPNNPDAGQDVSPDVTPDQDTGSNCPTGYADCDGDEGNGCEVELATDPDHCGTCDIACTVDNGTGECVAGTCNVVSCAEGYGDCDDDPATGCETDTTTSAAHCGSCENGCLYDNAIAICASSTCSMGDCETGYADCDDQDANGCEVSTATSVDDCGTCGNACEQRPNSVPLCEGGQCGVLCDEQFGDCDGDLTNGCESDVRTDASHCGSCDTACSTENATPSCVSASCMLSCDQDFGDCDDDVATGCEAALLTDPNNCNTCGTICTPAAGSTATCEAGACGFACNAGLGDCNSDPLDGCETNVLTAATDCGACGRSCLGGDCIDGKCAVQQLSTGLNRPSGIVLDATQVYWTDTYDNSIYSVAKAGGLKAVVTTGGVDPYGPISIDGSTLYWATGASISRVSTSGAGKSAVIAGEAYIPDLTQDGSQLFWLRRGTFSGSAYNNDGEVAKAAIGGGSVTILANGQKRPLAIVENGSYVYWVNEGTYTGAVYNGDGSVLRVGKSGGAITTIATNQNKPCGIAVSSSSIYWTNCGEGVVMVKPTTGGAPEPLLSGQSISGGLRLDGTDLFWPYAGANPNQPTGDVRKAMTEPLTVFVLADAQVQPYRVAADATHVYWLNYGGDGDPPPGNGAVMRVPR